MSKKDEALKLALEALDGWRKGFPDHWGDIDEYSVDAIREALAEESSGTEQPAILECHVQARPLSHSLHDYHIAMSEGPLHFTWTDKPHRLVYDLISAVKYYAAPQPDMNLNCKSVQARLATSWGYVKAEQPVQQQEPVGMIEGQMYDDGTRASNVIHWASRNAENDFPVGTLLYTSPPAQRTWVGLTQQDIDIAFDDTQEGGGFDDFARAIEAKLKEKNA